MKAPYSKSLLSCHRRRSSSPVSKGPSRLQRTRCWGVATEAIGSICRNPIRRTVSRIVVALPSRSCPRTAMRRACARLTVVDFTAFVLSQLPPPPVRVLELGCGPDGGITPALAAAGHEVLGVDPRAPDGERYRKARFEELEEQSFDAVVGERVLHHVEPLGPALDKLTRL